MHGIIAGFSYQQPPMLATVRLLVFLTILVFVAPSRAQTAPQAAPAEQPAATLASAELKVGTRSIFVFRSSLAGFPARDRADGARKRLDKAIAAGGPQHAGTRSIGEGTQVLLDGHLLFLVTANDVNTLAGDTVDEVAQEAAAALNRVLLERREQGSPRALLVAGAWCLAATLGYWLVLRSLGILHRRVRAFTKRSVSRKLEQVRFQDVEAGGDQVVAQAVAPVVEIGDVPEQEGRPQEGGKQAQRPQQQAGELAEEADNIVRVEYSDVAEAHLLELAADRALGKGAHATVQDAQAAQHQPVAQRGGQAPCAGDHQGARTGLFAPFLQHAVQACRGFLRGFLCGVAGQGVDVVRGDQEQQLPVQHDLRAFADRARAGVLRPAGGNRLVEPLAGAVGAVLGREAGQAGAEHEDGAGADV